MDPRWYRDLRKSTFLCDVYLFVRRRFVWRRWEDNGRPIPPPPEIKQVIVDYYRRKFGSKIFIETGTYLGQMVEAHRRVFNMIYTIELDRDLYARAQRKFAPFPSIRILQGDSAKILPSVLTQVTQSALFWLDAHYSGGITARGLRETPILEELRCILHHPVDRTVVLIDDARMFTGEHDYPTLDELKKFVFTLQPRWSFSVVGDVIRIHQ